MTPQRFARLQRILAQRQADLTVVTDGVHKPHNISAILRTCDAVGVRRIHAVAAAGKVLRHDNIASGSKRWVDIVVHPTIDAAYAELRSDGFTILAAGTGEEATDFRDCDFTERTAVVLGAERRGTSAAAVAGADGHIAIPMHGLVESLNVSVAAAVILYEAQQQKLAAGHYGRCTIDEPEYTKTLFEWAYPDIAKRCRLQSLPYPALTADGDLAENPFADDQPS